MIVSHAEVLMREQQGLQKNMNYRDDGRPSVFLISDKGDEHTDEWHEDEQLFIVEGHDASTKGAKKKVADQELVHESGHLSDNGKFYREANKFKDGVRKDAMQIQVYERLDAGVWYDKGIFDLIDAQRHMKDKRRTFKFVLAPAYGGADEVYARERMVPARVKCAVWERDQGRCVICGSDTNLYFEAMQHARDGGAGDDADNISLRCALHAAGEKKGFL
jgi:hypothetical protein